MRCHAPYQAALVLLSLGFGAADAVDDLPWRTPGHNHQAPRPHRISGSLPVARVPVSHSDTIQTPHYNPLAPIPPRIESREGDNLSHGQETAANNTVISIASSVEATRRSISQVDDQQPLPTLPPSLATQPTGLNVPEFKKKAGQHGQVWREYDLRPYTGRPNIHGQTPQQAIVDWVLRETGTETWFSDPFGALNASRDTLRVYHTPAIQQVVADIVNRFMRADQTNLSFGARLVTLASPNWRTTALSMMRPVAVQSSGVEAWLVSKENVAVLLAQLHQRSDYREHNSPNLVIRNGETHEINRTRPISYVHSLQSNNQPWSNGALVPSMRQIKEGFKMRISPLLAADGRTVDAVVKIETSQLELLSNVRMSSTVGATTQRAEIQVPQTSSWRLHERFRWPVNEVLIISCGLVASPTAQSQPNKLLSALAAGPPRCEAILFLEAKERPESIAAGTPEARVGAMNYRGRY